MANPINLFGKSGKEVEIHDTGAILTKESGNFVRHSTAAKPAGKEGDSLYLWDTKAAFIHDGTDWRAL